MTTREEIIAVAKEAGLQTYLTRDCHWTGLGKFYAIAHEAGVASRDAEVARLKTVPMRYRRMAFNAQLQDEVARLEQERDQLREQVAMLRNALAACKAKDEALRAQDAATWREAMQIAEDSRDKATMSKYSSVPECRAARDMAECLSKAYCHKADAIEKGGE